MIVRDRMAVEFGLNKSTKQFHPLDAVGSPMTPDDAVPPVPTLTRNVAVPLLLPIVGDDPKPLEIVGAVGLINSVACVIVMPVESAVSFVVPLGFRLIDPIDPDVTDPVEIFTVPEFPLVAPPFPVLIVILPPPPTPPDVAPPLMVTSPPN